VVSVVPVVGNVASVVNAGVSVARGDYKGAALNLAGAIPVAGNVMKGTSLAAKVVNAGAKALKTYEKIDSAITNAETVVEVTKAVAEGDVDKLLEKGEDYLKQQGLKKLANGAKNQIDKKASSKADKKAAVKDAQNGQKKTAADNSTGADPESKARQDALRDMRDEDRALSSRDRDFYGGDGVVYRVPGSATPSNKPYIGTADDKVKRAKTARDGRDRSQAVEVDRYPIGDTEQRRAKEQRAIDAEGGIENLDNRRNEIRKEKN
jgi:hypothetical protein